MKNNLDEMHIYFSEAYLVPDTDLKCFGTRKEHFDFRLNYIILLH